MVGDGGLDEVLLEAMGEKYFSGKADLVVEEQTKKEPEKIEEPKKEEEKEAEEPAKEKEGEEQKEGDEAADGEKGLVLQLWR